MSTSPNRWLITNPMLSALAGLDAGLAAYFFDAPGAFVLGGAVAGYSAQAVAGFESYQTFSQKVASVTSKWVMYDNENWPATPTIEAQHPGQYMQEFASLAHLHGLKVISAPAQDLVYVAGADCGIQSGESAWQAYLRCEIPELAQYADILEIQAQADQPTVATYADVISTAKAQVRALAPDIGLMAGLTTDRGGSAEEIFAAWQASVVPNFWINTQAATVSVAAAALTLIRAAGG